MIEYQPVGAIEVRARGRMVGALAPSGRRGTFAFEYTPDWLRNGVDLAPLVTPRRVGVFTGPAPQDDPNGTFHGLPPFIADSLPGSFGNQVVNAYLAHHSIDPAVVSSLDRLAYLGDRGMGALEFRPATPFTGEFASTALNLRELVDGARQVISGHLRTDPASLNAIHRLIEVGISGGGARAKALVLYNPDTKEIRPDLGRAPDPGFRHVVLKLDGMESMPGIDTGSARTGAGYGRREYAYHLMAVHAGINMTTCELIEENGRAHFLTHRFDRGEHGRKLHMQSLCGLMALDYQRGPAIRTGLPPWTYHQYMEALDHLGLGNEKQEAFRRIVFNVFASNYDDHTKNLSFLQDEHGTWSLAPAYDVCFAFNPHGAWTSRHQMSLEGKATGINEADLLTFGDRHGIADMKHVIRDVKTSLAQWGQWAARAGLDNATRDNIEATFFGRGEPGTGRPPR